MLAESGRAPYVYRALFCELIRSGGDTGAGWLCQSCLFFFFLFFLFFFFFLSFFLLPKPQDNYLTVLTNSIILQY